MIAAALLVSTSLLAAAAPRAASVAPPTDSTARSASGVPSRRTVAEFGAVGDGVADDTPAWRAAVAAMREGGTLEVGGRLRVNGPATLSSSRVRLVGAPGATIVTRGAPALMVTGSDVEIDGLRFESSASGQNVDAGVVVQDAAHVNVRSCTFGRVTLLARTTTRSPHAGLRIEGNRFEGDYSGATAADTYNVLDVRGYEDVFVTGNHFSVKNPYRVIKLSSALGAITGALTSGFTSRVIVSGNVITGSLAAGKQVSDLFAATNRIIISGNVISMTGDVAEVVSTKPEGDAPGYASVDQVGPLLIEGNIVEVPAASTGVFTLAGPYALPFYDPGRPAVVAIRHNSIRCFAPATSARPTIQVKGFDDAIIEGNQITRAPIPFGSSIMLGHVRRATVADNSISFGEIRVSEGLQTPNATAYASGSTWQVTIRGNDIGEFDAPGAVWVTSAPALGSLVIAGNTVRSSEESPRIDSVVYIDKTAARAVTVTGNVGDLKEAAKNRFRYGPSTTVESRSRAGNSFDLGAATLDPGPVAPGASVVLGPIPVWGAQVGDGVSVVPPYPVPGGAVVGWVEGPNEIRVRVTNERSSRWLPGPGLWKARIFN